MQVEQIQACQIESDVCGAFIFIKDNSVKERIIFSKLKQLNIHTQHPPPQTLDPYIIPNTNSHPLI